MNDFPQTERVQTFTGPQMFGPTLTDNFKLRVAGQYEARAMSLYPMRHVQTPLHSALVLDQRTLGVLASGLLDIYGYSRPTYRTTSRFCRTSYACPPCHLGMILLLTAGFCHLRSPAYYP